MLGGGEVLFGGHKRGRGRQETVITVAFTHRSGDRTKAGSVPLIIFMRCAWQGAQGESIQFSGYNGAWLSH